ncbi:MAG TPA: DivIVA domain-containing protein [Acidimicrobiia bacterium]|nr:DivIVA domain-containing protein [Acidimicrobiia bacterium]
MPLTPIDIQQKTFGPELRGYNMDEVDDFLDEVVATLKDYDQRVRDAQDRIRALEAEIATRGEDETAISRALVAAQKQADTMLSEAREEAEAIRNEAHGESDRLRSERDAERQSLTQDIARMRATVADLKRRVVELAASAENDLDAMDVAAAEASSGIAVTDQIEMTVDVAEDAEVDSEMPAAIEEIEEVEEIEVVEEFEESDAPPADDLYEDEAVLLDDEDSDEDAPYADDVDDETWAEVEGSYEDGDADHDGPDEGKDIGELADELAGEASARSGQHLSDEAGGRAGRRPWERGSV